MAYHPHCYRFYLSRELKGFDKKAQLGSLTMAEAKFMEDIQYQLNIARVPPKTIPSKKDPYLFCCKRNNNAVLFECPPRRLEASQDIRRSKQEELEKARSLRWAWESFNTFEGVKLIDCDNNKKPMFPLENMRFLEEKN